MKPKTLHILSIPFYRTQGFVKWHKQEQINLNQTIQTTQTDFLNDFILKELQFSLNHSMFNRLDQHSKVTFNKDYFNRNRTSENIGSLFKDQTTLFHSFEVSPTAKSDISLELESNKLNQFSSDQVNQTTTQLLANSTQLNYRKKSNRFRLFIPSFFKVK